MDFNGILKEKKTKNTSLRDKLALPKWAKALWLLKISDKSLIKDLRDWLLILPAAFVIEIAWVDTEKLWPNIVATWKIDKKELAWFDFVVWTDDLKVNPYIAEWITPIVSKENTLNWILKEFNPIKTEWNAYIFDKTDKWNVIYAITRYLENYKFSYDNKNLVKNVLDI